VHSRESLVLLRHYLDLGLKKTVIARQLGLNRRTIHHWILTGQLDREIDAATPRRPARRAQQLDPFTPLIDARLKTYPALSAVRLFQECRAAGYPGGITQLRDYVMKVRPRPEPEPIVRFETAPGLQAQCDFAELKLPWGKRYAFLVVLGYSRVLFIDIVARQTALTVMLGLERAFAMFGGVPREILFDQMKSVVVADHRPGGGRLLENPEFLRFAAHWGFRVRACRPYRAQTKGKVERPVGYFRTSFFYGRTFLNDPDLGEQATRWTTDVANQRVHGTTKESPLVRFARDEQHTLLPLAARPYRSLILLPETSRIETRPRVPTITVEQRALSAYSALAAEAH